MTRTLKTLTRTQGNNYAIKQGDLQPEGFRFEFEEVNPLPKGFRRMVRNLDFDVSEMALTTYLCAREHGVRFTALPIFLVREFHHGAILHNQQAGFKHPKDLEGQRVGVNRGYTVTTGVWARAILERQYGVDLNSITWVLSGDEHVESWQAPGNVVPLAPGLNMEEELASGRLPAAIGVKVDHPEVETLIPNAYDVSLKALKETGLYPINHLMVIRDDVLAEYPEVAKAVFDTFVESKTQYLRQLNAGVWSHSFSTDQLHRDVTPILGDPLPYGIEPNRPMLDLLVSQALRQGILTRKVSVDEVFAAGTRHLTG
ncbi:MAG: hypothetical protein ABJ000_04490 [Saccharospirillum sp.]|uniref:hypothetical protein n=1 Tax=Saccharospirillum sp. TaxID=2033801 RepID=UPI00329A1E1C